jgi:hypothetical protein
MFKLGNIQNISEELFVTLSPTHPPPTFMNGAQEYYKLDFEDNIGGLKTRFRYKDVPAQHFGLSTEDILSRPDRELNQARGLHPR